MRIVGSAEDYTRFFHRSELHAHAPCIACDLVARASCPLRLSHAAHFEILDRGEGFAGGCGSGKILLRYPMQPDNLANFTSGLRLTRRCRKGSQLSRSGVNQRLNATLRNAVAGFWFVS